MPLLAMMYTRGEKFSDERSVEGIKHAARIAAELGADIVKVSYPGSMEGFEEVVSGCPIPVVIAGGEKAEDDRQVCQIIKDSIDVGGAGVSIGRNAFQHENKRAMVKAICGIVHEGLSVDKALEILNS
jgi:class I fructose-bisphosphate aldolase